MRLSKVFNSNTALILGVLLVCGAIQNFNSLLPGISVIVGTFAYISASNRNRDINHKSRVRLYLEIISLFLIVLAVAWQNDLKRLIIEDPISNISIPAWIITAYLTVAFDKYFSPNGNTLKRMGAIICGFIIVNVVLFSVLYSIPIKDYFLSSETQTRDVQSESHNQSQEVKKPWQLSLYSESVTLMRLDYDSKESCLSAGNFYYKDGSTQYKRFDCGYNCIGNKSDLSAGLLCTTVCDNYGCK